MGKSITKKPVIGDTPIKEPTGRMRPVGESVPIRPHEHALSTFAPRFLGEGPPQELEYRSDAYQEKLAVLEKRLKQTARKDETGSFVVLRSDVFKFCQQIAVPLDDVEINSHVKRLIPDASGRVRLTEVVMSLRNHGFKPSSRPKPSPEFVGITEQYSKQQVPRSALRAAEKPDRTPLTERAPMPYPGCLIDESKMTYEMIPSCPNPQPHRSAERMKAILAAPGQTTQNSVQLLKVALAHADHNGSFILPRSTVMQYMKLYGIWSFETSPQLLASLEPPGRTRCVDYGALLKLLAP